MITATIYQITARITFVLSSYGLHIILSYFIQDLTDYGRVGVVFSMLAMARVFLTTGVPQGISCFVAKNSNQAEKIFWGGLKLQLSISIFVAIVYIFGAWVWSRICGDQKLLQLVLVSVLVIPGTGVYQAIQGYLAGKQLFVVQSKLFIFYSCARIVFVLLLIILGAGIVGVFWGIVIAVVLSVFVSAKVIKIPIGSAAEVNILEILNFSLPILFCALGMTVMLNIDLLILKSFYTEDPIVGYYAGAVNVGKLPYFILVAFATIMLPTISKALQKGDKKEVLDIVRKELGLLWALVILGIAIVAGAAPYILDFIYPANFIAASTSLKILFAGSCFMAVSQSFVAILGALNRVNRAVIVFLVAVAVQLLLGKMLAPELADIGVAIANASASFAVMIALTIVITRLWGFPFNVVDCLLALAAAPIPYSVMLLQENMPLIMLPFLVIAASIIYFAVLSMISPRLRENCFFLLKSVSRRKTRLSTDA